MKTTWGIYAEQQAGTLELYKSGKHTRALDEGLYLFLALSRELEEAVRYVRPVWSFHLVAWPGEIDAPEVITRAVLATEVHAEIELKMRAGKGVQVPVELPEFTLGIDPAVDLAARPAPWSEQIVLVRMTTAEFAEFQAHRACPCACCQPGTPGCLCADHPEKERCDCHFCAQALAAIGWLPDGRLAKILELVPENYQLCDAHTHEAGTVMEIYELLHGAELTDPDDEAPVL